MKLFNLFVGRLVKSNLAFTEADASQIKSFIEAILFSCEGKTNGTRIGGMTLLVILLSKSSGSTVHVAWPLVWLDRLFVVWSFMEKKYCWTFKKKSQSQLSRHFPEKPFQAPKIIFKSPNLIGQKFDKRKRLKFTFLTVPTFQVLVRGSSPSKKN